MKYNNWRQDPGITCQVEYRKKFAILPVKCSDGITIWFATYYKKYEQWKYGDSKYHSLNEYSAHYDFVECITPAEYIVRKLSENL